MNKGAFGRARLGRLAVLAGVAFVVAALVVADPNTLCLLPALVLAAPLVLRRYPGERMIAALSGAGRRRWARPRSNPSPLARAVVAVAPRGGLLLARSLAVRPPPAAGFAGS